MSRYAGIWRSRAVHAVAFAIGLVIFGMVFAASGDGDLLFAAMSGIGGGLLTYIFALLHIKPRSETD